MYFIKFLFIFLLLLILWGILSIPIFLFIYFFNKKIVQIKSLSNISILLVSFVIGFLIAPIPTPIITVLMPNYIPIFNGYYFDSHLYFDDPFNSNYLMLKISLISIVLTIISTYLLLKRYITIKTK